MSQEPGPQPSPPPAPMPEEPKSFVDIWIDALTRPVPETFEMLARDPSASPRKAYTWVFICGLIAYAISAVENTLFASLTGSQAGGAGMATGVMMVMICGAPFGGAMAVLALAINAGITQLIARTFGGEGTYTKLVYAFGCFVAPLGLIGGLIGGIPFVQFLSVLIGLYALWLSICATKAVHRFDWGPAVATTLIPPIALGILVACCVVGAMALLAPVIGNVFSNIVEDIAMLVTSGANLV